MFPMVDPQKMAQIQEVSQHITAAIEVDYKERTVILALSASNEQADELIRMLLGQFKGAIEDANKAGLKVHVTARDGVEVVVESIGIFIGREF